MNRHCVAICLVLALVGPDRLMADESGPPLPGTKLLTIQGDIASELVAGVDRLLLKQIDESMARRARYWKRDTATPIAYAASIGPNRQRLQHILGVRDARPARAGITRLEDNSAATEMLKKGCKGIKEIHAVSWPAFGDVTGEGLEVGAGDICVIVIPDADQTPEQLAGLVQAVPLASQVAAGWPPAIAGC